MLCLLGAHSLIQRFLCFFSRCSTRDEHALGQSESEFAHSRVEVRVFSWLAVPLAAAELIEHTSPIRSRFRVERCSCSTSCHSCSHVSRSWSKRNVQLQTQPACPSSSRITVTCRPRRGRIAMGRPTHHERRPRAAALVARSKTLPPRTSLL